MKLKIYVLKVNFENVWWGNIGKGEVVFIVNFGDIVMVDVIIYYFGDDYEWMIKGDVGVEDIFYWIEFEKMEVDCGLGVYIMIGLIVVEGVELGDVLEVKILDMKFCFNGNGEYVGKIYGFNVVVNWGFFYGEMEEELVICEVVMIYEMDLEGGMDYVKVLYSYRWMF